MTTLYIVRGSTGAHYDRMHWDVCAFGSSEAADAERDRLQAIASAWDFEALRPLLNGDDSATVWRACEACANALRPHDPHVSVDHTGVTYFVAEIPFKG